tara:strand:- start:726 stop:1088 length:363 start_codon:yes stop_codon:yes gene_type:complete
VCRTDIPINGREHGDFIASLQLAPLSRIHLQAVVAKATFRKQRLRMPEASIKGVAFPGLAALIASRPLRYQEQKHGEAAPAHGPTAEPTWPAAHDRQTHGPQTPPLRTDLNRTQNPLFCK